VKQLIVDVANYIFFNYSFSIESFIRFGNHMSFNKKQKILLKDDSKMKSIFEGEYTIKRSIDDSLIV
jgi:hypothetical protein